MKTDVKKILMENWGEKAESMSCYAELKLSLVDRHWDCYIYAIDPNDEDKILCIIQDHGITSITEWSLKDLFLLHDLKGEHPVIDLEYRKMRACELFKRLNEVK